MQNFYLLLDRRKIKMERIEKSASYKMSASDINLKILAYAVVGIFTLICLIPFVVMTSSSFNLESDIIKNGYCLFPRKFSLLAYKVIFSAPDRLIGSYILTICNTLLGTTIGLFLISMTGYVLQRPDYAYRNAISFYIYFTTLFSGGLVPYYLLITRGLHLKDNYLVLLIPGLMNPWLIILMKNFMKSIPHEITESAKIDGAGDFTIFIKLILPLAKPALATVGLFLALGYWNEWFNGMLFLSTTMKYKPLQLYLYEIITKADMLRNTPASKYIPPQNLPTETAKLATAVIATGPIVLAYPFVQRYFIKGITIGAVKG